MLELFSSGLLSLWLQTAGGGMPTAALTSLQEIPWAVSPGSPDPAAQLIVQQYLQTLGRTGLATQAQGVWLQSGTQFIAANQGTTPLPAASLTKVATSLAALQTWGADHQFETLISTTGPIQNGVLQGDLVVQGGGDPLLVWEEAIALGNDLNRAGITRVTGNLVITGNFLMNFETRPQQAGELLRQAFNARAWSGEIEQQYKALPSGTPRPQVTIAGRVQTVTYGTDLLPNQILLVRHRSLPLTRILKLMNVYSNNVIAESLANSLGGAAAVVKQSALAAAVPASEIRLINGSGLGAENQISPRAVCGMFAALQRYLQLRGLTIADVFPIAGTDPGSIEGRSMPMAAVVKTGTLNDVSALAGVVPTADRQLVWFTIINRGTDLDGLRRQQDVLLQTLVQRWGKVPAAPLAIAPSSSYQAAISDLGDSDRNQLLQSAVEFNTYQGN